MKTVKIVTFWSLGSFLFSWFLYGFSQAVFALCAIGFFVVIWLATGQRKRKDGKPYFPKNPTKK